MKKLLSLTFLVSLCVMMASAQKYKVGDIYDANGLKGVVISVDASGEHGLIMHPTGFAGRWCKSEVIKETEAFDENDGAKNMAVIENYIKETGKSWDLFPLFKWARELGEGWYIPANAELKALALAMNGGTMEYSEKTINQFSKIVKKAGGKGFINKGLGHSDDFMNIYSSTEVEGGTVFALYFKEKTSSKVAANMLGKFAKRKGTLELAPVYKEIGSILIKTQFARAVHKF